MIQSELLYGDSNRLLKINTNKGDVVTVQAGAMVAMSPIYEIKSTVGSLGKMLGRMFSGESAFVQKFLSNGDGELLLAPEFMGDISKVTLTGAERYRLGNSAFLASTENIDINIKSGGGKGLFSGEGLIQMEASGFGELYVSAYGAIHEVNLKDGERYIIDTNHLVLWESKMKYKIEMASGIFSSITGGEGLVCNFVGPGSILIQTRNPADLLKPHTK